MNIKALQREVKEFVTGTKHGKVLLAAKAGVSTATIERFAAGHVPREFNIDAIKRALSIVKGNSSQDGSG